MKHASHSMRRPALALSLLAAGTAADERADGFLSRAIRIVVPFPQSGLADGLAAPRLAEPGADQSQTVVVKNQPSTNMVGHRRPDRRQGTAGAPGH
jgi:tripartite-type tricarboxylate transporter receptor subunit TctC